MSINKDLPILVMLVLLIFTETGNKHEGKLPSPDLKGNVPKFV